MNNQAMKQGISQVATDVEGLLAQINMSPSFGESIKEKVTPMLASARDSLGHAGEAVKERAVDAAKKTDAYAHKNPWQVAGIAAVIGLGLGALASSRRR